MALFASGYILSNGYAKLVESQSKKRLQFGLRREGDKLVAVVNKKEFPLSRKGDQWVAAGNDVSIVIRRKPEKNLWTVIVFKPDIRRDALALLAGAEDSSEDEEAGL